MRALKTAQFFFHLDFSWQRIPRLQNTVGPSRVSLSFDLAHCKDFSETATISSEHREVCKSRFWCTLMMVLKRVYTVFWETVGKIW